MAVAEIEADIRSATGAAPSTPDAEIEQFVAGVSHDLESSLLVLAKNIELLRAADATLSPDQEDHLARIERTVERMKRLLATVRTYTSASREPALAPVSLESVVRESIEIVGEDAEERGAQIIIRDLPTVNGDHDQLVQLFQNLLSNAIKFGPRGGRIEATAARDHDEWRIVVADEGPGVALDHRDRVFEPFRRLRETGHVPGTGLGLTICRRVAQNHGGSIAIERSEAGGAAFVVTLPDAAGQASTGAGDD